MPDVRALSFDDLPDDPTPVRRGKPNVRDLDFSDLPDAAEPLTPLQGGAAVASGFNRAVIAGGLGLPAKLGADVIDLARAGYGYAGSKLGILKPDELPSPLDRSKVFGSPEWIAKTIEDSGDVGKAAIANPRPDSQTARLLNAGGYGMGSAMTGDPKSAAMNFASGVSGQLAAENGASPEWAMVASMGPQVATQGLAASARGAVRGGEAGRRDMERRVQEFRDAGIDPTVGLATGNRRTQALESLLAKTPGAAGAMAAKTESMRGQFQQGLESARDALSPNYGPAVAGEALLRGAQSYRDRQQGIYRAMTDRAAAMVPEGMTFPVTNMLQRGEATLANVPNAPNVSAILNQPRSFTRNVVDALREDTQAKPPQSIPSAILGPNGEPLPGATIPGSPGGLSMEGIKALKSRVGDLAYQNNPLNADANTGALKYLHGGAKADLMNAAQLADAQRVANGQAPGVYSRMDRANRFYAQTSQILEDVLAPLHKAAEQSPERGYQRFESMTKAQGGNVQRAMAALPLDVRREVSATLVDRMGRVSPGGQNAAGDVYSPASFLTNWNRLDPGAKRGILLGIPNGGQVGTKLDRLALAAERMKDANKVYANPSGTSGAVAGIGALTGLAYGAHQIASGNVKEGLITAGGVIASATVTRLGAAAMTNPKAVDWLAAATVLKPHQMAAHLKRLNLMAAQEKDPASRATLEELASGLSAELAP